MDIIMRALILGLVAAILALVAMAIITPTPDCSPVPAIAAAHGCQPAVKP